MRAQINARLRDQWHELVRAVGTLPDGPERSARLDDLRRLETRLERIAASISAELMATAS